LRLATDGARKTFAEYRDELIADSKHYGMGERPAAVIHDLHQQVALNHTLMGAKTYRERALRAAIVFDHLCSN
jgi:hypothetical protein